jgi:hypothetical protein
VHSGCVDTPDARRDPSLKPSRIGALAIVLLSAAPGGVAFANALTYFQTVFNTNVSISAIGMRDVGTGNIQVTGVSGRVTRAILFWHGPTNSTNPNINANVRFAGNAIVGNNIGFSDDNFWNSSNSQAYMAEVSAFVSGNGSYALSGFPTMINGASLWVFFDDGNPNNNRDVVLFVGNDSNYSSQYDSAGWNILLDNITYTTGTAFLRIYASDGQNFSSFDDGDLAINGSTIASGGIFQGLAPKASGAGVSNGSLADVLAYEVTSFLRPGRNSLRATLSDGFDDAVSAVAFAIDLPSGAAPLVSGLHFVPITPCRVADTRLPPGPFGSPSLAAQATRDFAIPSGSCAIPATAAAYSINLTVVPKGPLGYIAIWPAGLTRPVVSTLNSLDGRIKANAAIVPAGNAGGVSVFADAAADVVLDINGFFVPPGTRTDELAFYPIEPCRMVDTRLPNGPLGGPAVIRQQRRTFPVAQICNVPTNVGAYSLNVTAVPSSPLGFVTLWPTGRSQPLASTLNALTGTVTANAAISPSGTNGSLDVFATDATHMVMDVNGYFAAPGGAGAMKFYPVTPCRTLDTRLTGSGGQLIALVPRDQPATCGVPTAAGAFSMNATVVPPNLFGFLTLWPTGSLQPLVSTLNAVDGSIVANAAVVRAGTNGSIRFFGSENTHLILDINGFFAP